MTIQELFVRSNQVLGKVIAQIKDDQWNIPLPPGMSSAPTVLGEAVQRHTYDDAWVPDVLAGKTKDEVGGIYEHLLSNEDIKNEYAHYNQRAVLAVESFTDLDRTTHLSYGDYPAKDYLQHIISFRAFRAYDIAKLIGADTKFDDDFVQALLDEFTPAVEGYRQMGVFPPALEVADDADPQKKLLAMVGRS